MVSSQCGWQNLDGDLTLQLRVGRPIHLAHPAFADLRGDVVNAEAGAWSEGQMWHEYMGKAAASARLLLSDAGAFRSSCRRYGIMHGHATRRSASTRLSHSEIRFQLAKFRLTQYNQ